MTTDNDRFQRPHVLIVSDDLELSTFLGEGLVFGGFWTSVIASGIQTLEVLRLRTFDIALIDAQLSGLGAKELVRRIRSSGSLVDDRSDLPILQILDSVEQLNGAEPVELGLDGVLLPPLEIEQLIPTLFEVVQAWRANRPRREWADKIAQVQPSDHSNG